MRPERCRSAGCRSLSLLLGRPVQGPPRSFLPLRCRAPIWVRPPPGAPVCGSPWAEGRAIRQICARWSGRLSGPHSSRSVSDLESLRAISGFGFAHRPFGGVGLHRAIPANPGRCASDALSCPSGRGYAATSIRRRLATTPLPWPAVSTNACCRGLASPRCRSCRAYKREARSQMEPASLVPRT